MKEPTELQKVFQRQIFIKERLADIRKEQAALLAEQKINRDLIAKSKPAT